MAIDTVDSSRRIHSKGFRFQSDLKINFSNFTLLHINCVSNKQILNELKGPGNSNYCNLPHTQLIPPRTGKRKHCRDSRP
jgi:hypothetical protein